jgi:hypothetical protein
MQISLAYKPCKKRQIIMSTLDLQAINNKLGLSDESDRDPVNVNITEQDVNHLRSIIEKGGGEVIDTKPANQQTGDTKNQLPAYMEEFKEELNKKYDAPTDDKTNWTEKAMQELGPNYTHITSRDAFQTEIFLREAQFNFLNSNPDVRMLNDLVKGVYDPRQILSDPAYEEQLKTRVDQFFDENGELNQKGNIRYGELMQIYKNHLASIYNQAKEHANNELVKYNEFKTTLLSEIRTYKPAGLEIPEAMGEHLANFIISGKAKEFYDTTPQTPKEAAQKEIMLALIADKKLFAEFVNMLNERGVHYGATESSKKFFKQSNQ